VTKAPKAKLPYIRHGDNMVADSHFIMQYLVNTFGEGKTHLGQLRIKLTPEERARSVLLERICADDLYCVLLYSRWVMEEGWKKMVHVFFSRLPNFLLPIIPAMVRRSIANWMHGHGFSRHSYGDIVSMIDEQLEAISILLGDQTYFNGSEPTIADPPVFAMLDAIMGVDVDPLGLQDIVHKYANLERFRQHVRRTVYDLEE
jgi:glutathione S-transferase